jgi:hypothetical protein
MGEKMKELTTIIEEQPYLLVGVVAILIMLMFLPAVLAVGALAITAGYAYIVRRENEYLYEYLFLLKQKLEDKGVKNVSFKSLKNAKAGKKV